MLSSLGNAIIPFSDGEEHETPLLRSPVRVRDPFRHRDGGEPFRVARVSRKEHRSSLNLEYRPTITISRDVVTAPLSAAGLSYLASSHKSASHDDIFSQDRPKSLDRRKFLGQQESLDQRDSLDQWSLQGARLLQSGFGHSATVTESIEDVEEEKGMQKLNSSSIAEYFTPTPTSKARIPSKVSTTPLLKKAKCDAPAVKVYKVSESEQDGDDDDFQSSRSRTGGDKLGKLLYPEEKISTLPVASKGLTPTGHNLLRLKMLQVGSNILSVSFPATTLTASVDSAESLLRFSLNNKEVQETVTAYLLRASIERIWAYFSPDYSYIDVKLNSSPVGLQSLFRNSPTMDCKLVRLTTREGTTKLRINLVTSELRAGHLVEELSEPQEYRSNFEMMALAADTKLFARSSPPPSHTTKRYYTRASDPTNVDRISYAAHEDMVETVFRSAIPRTEAKPHLLFTYPPGALAHISITSNERLHLPEGVYLNDSLIDFDLRYILDHVPADVCGKVHIFSSFFYRKLSNMATPSGAPITKVHIFEKRFVFVPINESLHWYLALIFNSAAVLGDCNGDLEGSSQSLRALDRPCVIIFDSLGSKHRKSAVERLKSFLISEAKLKKGVDVSRKDIQAIYARVPTQINLTDCGCFLLEYVERFLKAPEDLITRVLLKEDLSKLFTPDDAALRRLKLIQLLEDLEADYRTKHGKDTEGSVDVPTASSDIEEISPPLAVDLDL